MMAVTLEELVSLAKRRGFVYQGSEIYGGLAGVWDYGPLGAQLKKNLIDSFWRTFVEKRSDIYGLDSSILMHPKVWQASGHLKNFVDPLVEDKKTGQRFRADHLLEAAGLKAATDPEEIEALIETHDLKSPEGNPLSLPSQFNLMFATQVGAQQDLKTYLRPETAQGIFVNFKNILDTFRPDLPFGIAQVGKAFRNEISPRDFLFRAREFEQLEIEYFCRVKDWEDVFANFQAEIPAWFSEIGLNADLLSELEISAEERAHYSQRTIDFEFAFPFGRKELCGLAYRGDYDLRQQQNLSGKNLAYIDKKTQEKMLPVCIEPSLGVDRLFLALLQSAYRRDSKNERTYLAFKPEIAPVQYAVSPLLSNKSELVAKARQVWSLMQEKYGRVAWDDHGNIGKRYRRQDEIGTPWCVVIDFQTLEDNTVTRRHRDTLDQLRVEINKL